MPLPIEDYAIVGDCETAALVGRDGSIDWLCWPRFDSDACFAALVGAPEHGRWLIAPEDGTARVTRRYRPNTLILETRFENAEGAATLVDFMPGHQTGSSIVRLIIGERGSLAMRTELVIRFGYGATVPWMMRLDDGTRRAVAGPDMVLLRTAVPLRGEDLKTLSEFTVNAGETVPFALAYAPSHLPPPTAENPLDQLRATEQFWLGWAAKCKVSGPWADAVNRSLITLKALTYARTGGIVAAPTTSLPEHIGGPRNWDYRFCWLRDATLTLLALLNAGYLEEAKGWREWLSRAAAGTPDQLQIMYGIAGERRLTEWEVSWLPGYRKSSPVRVGNAAYTQLQLDVYGELMDALHHARLGGLASSQSGWSLQRAVLKHLEGVWPRMDEGIWEVRSGARHFTFSKIMAWVHSIARSKAPKHSTSKGHLIAGASSAAKFMMKYVVAASMLNLVALYVRTGRKALMPAYCFCRRSDFCRRRTRACEARLMRSRPNFSWTGWSGATTRRNPKTACRPMKVPFSHAVSGWWMPTCC